MKQSRPTVKLSSRAVDEFLNSRSLKSRSTQGAEPTGPWAVPGRYRHLLDCDGNHVGYNCGGMGNMIHIAQDQLKRMLAGGQFQHDFRLATTKVAVVLVRGKVVFEFLSATLTLAQRWPVDQQMVVTGIFLLDAGGGNAHAGQTELDLER